MQPRTEPFVLSPIPGFLPELLGRPLSRAVAWPVGATLLVRAADGDATVLIEIAEQPALAVHRVDPRASPPKRTPIPLTEASAQAVRGFVRRLAWLGGSPRSGHAPTELEAATRTLLVALRSLRNSEEAAALGPLAASAPDVATYLAVVAGAFEPIFLALDRGQGADAPSWLRTLLVALGGRVEPMLACAASTSDSDGGFAVLEGAALELCGLTDAALSRHLRATAGLGGGAQGDVCLHVAKMLRDRGREQEAAQWIRRGLLIRDDEVFLLRAVFELIRCGELDDAHAVLARHAAGKPGKAALIALAELLLWAGRTDEAERCLARLPDAEGPEVARLEGIVHALRQRPAEARAAFVRADALAPNDMESLLWLTECELRLGHREAALEALSRARMRVQTPVHEVLGSGLSLQGAPALDENVTRRPELEHLLEVLGEPLAPWRTDPLASALRVVERFAGNRGEWLTQRVPGRGGLGIERVRLPRADSILSSRDASADLVRAMGTMPLAELQARFDALEREFPDSPHPHCYRGEIDLWLGETERAITRFDRGLERAQARWAYVGRAAGEILLGRFAEAEATLARCALVYTPVRGATTHVYVGEMWRLRGEHARAVVDLKEAVSAKPGRVGAWMNLALAHHALGQHEEAHAIFARVTSEVPRLIWDAWRALNEPPVWPISGEHLERVFLAALRLMRGNRSSHTITYFDREGALCIARRAPVWRAALTSHATVLALALRNQLASG